MPDATELTYTTSLLTAPARTSTSSSTTPTCDVLQPRDRVDAAGRAARRCRRSRTSASSVSASASRELEHADQARGGPATLGLTQQRTLARQVRQAFYGEEAQRDPARPRRRQGDGPLSRRDERTFARATCDDDADPHAEPATRCRSAVVADRATSGNVRSRRSRAIDQPARAAGQQARSTRTTPTPSAEAINARLRDEVLPALIAPLIRRHCRGAFERRPEEEAPSC